MNISSSSSILAIVSHHKHTSTCLDSNPLPPLSDLSKTLCWGSLNHFPAPSFRSIRLLVITSPVAPPVLRALMCITLPGMTGLAVSWPHRVNDHTKLTIRDDVIFAPLPKGRCDEFNSEVATYFEDTHGTGVFPSLTGSLVNCTFRRHDDLGSASVAASRDANNWVLELLGGFVGVSEDVESAAGEDTGYNEGASSKIISKGPISTPTGDRS